MDESKCVNEACTIVEYAPGRVIDVTDKKEVCAGSRAAEDTATDDAVHQDIKPIVARPDYVFYGSTTPSFANLHRFTGDVEIREKLHVGGDLYVAGEIHTPTPIVYRSAWEFVPVLGAVLAVQVLLLRSLLRLRRELRAERATMRAAP